SYRFCSRQSSPQPPSARGWCGRKPSVLLEAVRPNGQSFLPTRKNPSVTRRLSMRRSLNYTDGVNQQPHQADLILTFSACRTPWTRAGQRAAGGERAACRWTSEDGEGCRVSADVVGQAVIRLPPPTSEARFAGGVSAQDHAGCERAIAHLQNFWEPDG